MRNWLCFSAIVLLGGASQAAETLPSGWMLQAPAGPLVHTGTMPQGIAVSPDGTQLAIAEGGFNPPALAIYRIPTLTRVVSIPLADAFGRPVWSDDSHVAVAGAAADAALLVDVRRRRVESFKLPKGTYPVYIAAARNGVYAAAGAGDDTVRIGSLGTLGRARPIPIGGFPGGLAFSADGNTVFVTVRSTNTLTAIDVKTARPQAHVGTGLHPCGMVFSNGKIYVAESDSDTIGIYRYAGHSLRSVASLSVADPSAGHELGVSPNSLVEAGGAIYATLGAANSVAMIRSDRIAGRLQAGWYPTDAAVVGRRLYVLDGKGEGARPNPQFRMGGSRDYIGAIEFGSLRRYLLPDAVALGGNPQGAAGWDDPPAASPIRANGPIRHVFFVLKENRTYDQILGDVAEGNGDATLAWFGGKVTPNEHAIARRFGLFDNAYTNGEVSAVGHMWSDGAFANDGMERFWPSIYANRNKLDAVMHVEGMLSTSAGFIWNAARRAHISFRDYGELVDPGKTPNAPWVPDVSSLRGQIDPRYVGWDLPYSDLNRFHEWRREFQAFVNSGRLPQLEWIWLPNDHTFGSKAGELTPSAYVAQNDYALGLLVDTISHSRVWQSSAIFVIEDDAQDGPDHVSDQRTTLYVASPYARPGLHHEHYTTVSILKTIEIVLGMHPLSTYDAMAVPLFAAFTEAPNLRPYNAVSPQIDITRRNAKTAYGARQSALLDFTRPDAASPKALNHILANNH